MVENTKICRKCKIEKPISQFGFAKSNRSNYRPWCKRCECDRTLSYISDIKQKYPDKYKEILERRCNRNRIRRNDKNYRELLNSQTSICHAKRYNCAKKLCKDISLDELITIICPVCNNIFGVTKSDYDCRERRGFIPTYCSQKCSGIAHSKRWRENSSYAKKIKEIQKIYKN